MYNPIRDPNDRDPHPEFADPSTYPSGRNATMSQ